ncbi:aminoacyl-tRNA ligase [Malassezia pachydermatis]|uniref:proline--tRNA ligase n=1 Tax=Malassezia pachydermatis TaxID=77020 RepID=A0A0M8MJL4_9BASI|nr:prolyl-trna synthetase [Malassezia pachydermatis]KOS13796.1 prolyl-trna synthetase [Malassezia pachydermatis]
MSESIVAALSSLSIQEGEICTVSHGAVSSPAEWADALNALTVPEKPDAYHMLKTLVFKPKTAKSETPVPVMVVTDDATQTNTSAIGAHLKLKDLRLAVPELLHATLDATKDDVSPFSVTQANASKLRVLVDQDIVDNGAMYAVHARSASQTVFTTGAALVAYLAETNVSLDTVAFSSLAAPAAPAPAAPTPKAKTKVDAKIPEAELIGITVRKDLDFPEWYQQVLRKGDMLDYYDVSGCYILKPWSFFVWESIQRFFDAEIKKIGVQNCYFPMFVSSDVLEREKDHIEGFAPEVAWVTKAGKSDLEKPVAIRPTSETVMYPYYAKWIQSHRDLPLRLNQWNSVVRWEFKHPQPFLRTREFLWQEGHTAHLHKEQADEEVLYILKLYQRVYEELLALPVVPGVKSEKEKFAGGLYTTTVEGYVPTTGRGIQGGTSHSLGQNFSKMFDITVQDPKATDETRGKPEGRLHVWQNSWGLSTRTIGVCVMVHGDDKGLVMPPRVAQIQVVLVPCGLGVKVAQGVKDQVNKTCEDVAAELQARGVRAHADLRDNYNPGFKFNDWELRGVPLRLEVGPKDLEAKSVMAVRRDTGAKQALPLDALSTSIPALLDTIHNDMFAKADAEFSAHRKVVTDWDAFTPTLNEKNHVIIPWCEVEECEDQIKDRSARIALAGEAQDERAPSMGAKSLCIPFDQSPYPSIEGHKCPQCGQPAKRWTMFGRSY